MNLKETIDNSLNTTLLEIYTKKDINEYYPTPSWIKEKLYKMIPNNTKTILDPCCGSGGLDFVKGYNYTLYDIEDHGVNATIKNFFDVKPDKKYDCVVLNPPFGQTNIFIKHAFEFSDNILLIAPIKKVVNSEFGKNIKKYYFDWRLSKLGFGIITSIGLFLLNKNTNSCKVKLPLKISKEYTFDKTFKLVETPPNKWFIVNRVTKDRILRNKEIISDRDLYAPGDDNAFISKASANHTKKGDRIKRQVRCFDSKEDALKFINLYKNIKNYNYIQNYIYLYGENILKLSSIPDLGLLKNI